MNGSIQIGRVLGITIRVHVLLLVLCAFLVMGELVRTPADIHAQQAAVVGALLRIAMLFGIVLLHELAHCVVAKRFGLQVVDITLWPLGGMARMSAMPESSRVEAFVAIAGPALNFVLAAIAFPLWLGAGLGEASSVLLRGLLFQFFVWNLLLGTFNLLPAFPMDGGRILRAFLGRKGDWVRATERAVRAGRVIALLLALFGLLNVSWLGAQSVLFFLIAVFVWWAGSQELRAVRARHGHDPFAAFREFAARATGWSQQRSASEFARAPAAPARAPAAPEERGGPEQGFTQEQIERLERFRGPLGSFRSEEV